MSLGIVASSFVQATAAWSPSDEGGLVAWYRADDLSLSDNDSVSSWSDASGNSRTLTSLSGTDPIYKTGISPGGSPVVRFSAGALGTSSFNRAAVGSLFFFGKWNANGTNQVGPYHGGTGAGFGFYQRNTNVVDVLFDGIAQFPGAASSSDFRSHGALVYDTGTPRGVLLLDDTSAGTTNAGARTPGVNPIFIGAPGAYMNADICEFVYFDHVLDSTARANLQTYFEARHL